MRLLKWLFFSLLLAAAAAALAWFFYFRGSEGGAETAKPYTLKGEGLKLDRRYDHPTAGFGFNYPTSWTARTISSGALPVFVAPPEALAAGQPIEQVAPLIIAASRTEKSAQEGASTFTTAAVGKVTESGTFEIAGGSGYYEVTDVEGNIGRAYFIKRTSEAKRENFIIVRFLERAGGTSYGQYRPEVEAVVRSLSFLPQF